MGVSINLHIYPVESLVREIDQFVMEEGGYREGALPAREFLSKVGNEFGRLTTDEFLVVWNEYYEDYNPASNFLSAVDDYYFPERRDHDKEDRVPEDYKDGQGYYDTFWADTYTTCSEGANASEILEAVFPEEFGWDGKFTRDEEDYE